MSQSQSQRRIPSRQQSRDRRQSQSRGQKQTQRMRHGLDSLDVAKPEGIAPGPELLCNDFGWDDDSDGDLMLSESVDPESDEPVFLPEPEADEALPDNRQLRTISDIIGSRPQRVVLQMEIVGDKVQARPTFKPRTADEKEALGEMSKLIENAFNDARAKFSDEDWKQLLGLQPVPPGRRLFLLARIAVDPNEKKALTKNLNSQRCGKFVAFPDGTPFNIQLLLPDMRGRGKGGSQENSFDRLPDAIKLLIYCSVLRDERSGQFQDAKGKSLDDADFMHEIVKRLRQRGVLDDPPAPKEFEKLMRAFRARLKRNGLEHLALNRPQRNQQDAATQEHLDSGEESKP